MNANATSMGTALFCILFAARAAMATVPSQITIQGRATDAIGQPLPAGSKGFVFRIFDQQVGGTEIWPGGLGDVQSVSTDADGLWSASVGASTPLTDTVFASDTRWLEVSVDGTILPRVRLVTGPYAQRVSTVDGAQGGWITTKVAIGPGTTAPGYNAFAAGEFDTASGNWSTVGGGARNLGSGLYATVAGGDSNTVTSDYGTSGGGTRNIVMGNFSVISGGYRNVTGNVSHNSVVGGGFDNQIYAPSGTISGGVTNRVGGDYSTVGGGTLNQAFGDYSVIPGGRQCAAYGNNSFACGTGAYTPHDGMFVWSDNASTISFPVDADPNLGTYPNFFCCRTTGGAIFITGINASGFTTAASWLPAGSGTWLAFSDKNAKHAFAEVDHADILDKVASLPITTWSYNAQGDSVRHIGPMAQDFRAAFGVGESEKYISPVDEAGVAFAAIKALKAENDDLRAQIAELRRLIQK